MLSKAVFCWYLQRIGDGVLFRRGEGTAGESVVYRIDQKQSYIATDYELRKAWQLTPVWEAKEHL